MCTVQYHIVYVLNMACCQKEVMQREKLCSMHEDRSQMLVCIHHPDRCLLVFSI